MKIGCNAELSKEKTHALNVLSNLSCSCGLLFVVFIIGQQNAFSNLDVVFLFY